MLHPDYELKYKAYEAKPLADPQYIEVQPRHHFGEDDLDGADHLHPHGLGFLTNFDKSRLGSYQASIEELEARIPKMRGHLVLVPEAYAQDGSKLPNHHALCFNGMLRVDLSYFWKIHKRHELQVEHLLNLTLHDAYFVVTHAYMMTAWEYEYERRRYLQLIPDIAEAMVAFNFFNHGGRQQALEPITWRGHQGNLPEDTKRARLIQSARKRLQRAIEDVLEAHQTAAEVLKTLQSADQ